VSGPKFGASAVPSLKQFVRDVAQAVPAAKGGGTVLDAWMKSSSSTPVLQGVPIKGASPDSAARDAAQAMPPVASVNDLGSGSDYTPFLQHLGVPSTDISSSGPYGVYHSVFDNFAWFTKFADPDFLYEQQMARIFGLQILRAANADVLPFDYEEYGHETVEHLESAKHRSDLKLGAGVLDFAAAINAAKRFQAAGAKALARQRNLPKDNLQLVRLNDGLQQAERALLLPDGLPHRPWYRHSIYAPGEYTGYAAVVIPGVSEALDKGDAARARDQLAALAAALERAAKVLESSH